MHSEPSTGFPGCGENRVPVFTARDPRSDDAARRIAIDCRRIAIMRRYKGIDMRVSVPVAAYRGVVFVASSEGAHEVRLVHRDPDLTITLVRVDRDQDVVAAWRSWAERLGLPALAAVEQAWQSGAVAGGGRADGLTTAKRRPRFAARRASGRIERMLVVHRGEREIIAYE